MAGWANPTVARLATRDDLDGENVCGLVLVCAWPMPSNVRERVAALGRKLLAVLPSEAYVYPPATIHCTIATLRAFTHGPMDDADVEACVKLWKPVLDVASSSPSWPDMPFRLRMNAPTLEGPAGIFRYDDVDGAITHMRAAIRDAIVEAGGSPVVGGGDRSIGRPLPGGGQVSPHIPDIVHSTVVRWKGEPNDRESAIVEFERVAEGWTPIEVTVSRVTAVLERVPYMHMLVDDAARSPDDYIWWST